MKRLQHLLFITGFLSVATFTGCKSHSEEKASYVSIPIEFDNSKEIKLSDFVQSMDVVPLETTEESLLAVAGRITYQKGRYYITSLQMGRAGNLLVFDAKGKFLFKIDRRGGGLGEYREMSEYTLTGNADILAFSTYEKIVKYDLQGNFIHERKYESSINEVSDVINDKVIIFRSLPLKGDERNLLTVIDTSLAVENSYFPVTLSEMKRMRGSGSFNNFSIHSDKVYFNYPFCDTIFNVTSGKREVTYYVDFGKKKLPADLFGDETDIMYKMKMIKRNGGVRGIIGFNVSDDYLYLCFSDYKSVEYFSLYNLKSHKVLTACKVYDDMYFKGFKYRSEECRVPRHYDGKDLLWTLEPETLIQAYNSYKQQASKDEWDKFASANANLVSVCSKLKEDDNPVLVRLKLK